LSDSHLSPTYSLKEVGRLRANGNVGLTDDIDEDAWRLKVENPAAGTPPLTLTLDDVKSLPRVEMITKFCCIEGWSVITQWAGARFIDFTGKFLAPGARVPNFVYLATPDDEYYVGLDAKSALHPQTLLAYEMNGAALEDEHGAPLRLVIPVKYGVKNLKRIGLIRYTDQKPDDYWNQQGYDWFVGL
jgi:DMSO/TMAO reductase YedYZ molybdopterin-dependent catalytic subunit